MQRPAASWYNILIALLGVVLLVYGFQVLRTWRSVGREPAQSITPPIRETDPVRGSSNAKVTIVEFSDFACEFCAALQPALKTMSGKYAESVLHVWKDFPVVDLHPEALTAAEAARCAQEQNSFWPFHDALLPRYRELSSSVYESVAQEIGLELQSFQQCRDSHRTRPFVDESQLDGLAAGVDGTPTLFLLADRQPPIVFTELPSPEQLESAITFLLNASPP